MQATYQWIVIFNPHVAENRASFGPFATHEEADEFPYPPGVSEDSARTITRLHQPVTYVEKSAVQKIQHYMEVAGYTDPYRVWQLFNGYGDEKKETPTNE